jgi:hypothetical protein
MSRYNNLPFPRGSTYWGGDSSLISASQMAYLEGRQYFTEDTSSGGNSGARVKVRVVRNSHATLRIKAGRGCLFGATTEWVGRKVRGYTAAVTDFGMAADDALVTSVAPGDLFYVVEEGPVKCAAATLTTGATALTVGANVSWGASGLITKHVYVTGLRRPYGMSQEAVTAAVTGGRAVVVVAGTLFSDIG